MLTPDAPDYINSQGSLGEDKLWGVGKACAWFPHQGNHQGEEKALGHWFLNFCVHKNHPVGVGVGCTALL